MTDPFVVVGADAAGLSAASKCRRTDPDREVIVLDAGRWVSFAHCGTPYYVKGEITELTAMTALTPADVRERGIDLRTGHRVTAVDTSQQRVTADGPDGQTEVGYGELLIATGAHARTTPLSDEALAGVFTLHGLDDAAAIRAFLTDPDAYDRADVGADERLDWDRVDAMGAMAPPAQLAIIGGGYVGVEMAEALAAWDVEVVLLHRGAGLLETFGQTAGERAVDALEALGVTVELGTEVRSVEAADGQVSSGARDRWAQLAGAGGDRGHGDRPRDGPHHGHTDRPRRLGGGRDGRVRADLRPGGVRGGRRRREHPRGHR
jgi:Uncharacterized NAD(FAD)-dependent dehydrogenases